MAANVIGFIGGGNMGEALIRGILRAKLFRPQQVLLSEPDRPRRDRLVRALRVRRAAGNLDLARRARCVVLAVKPQLVPAVLAEIAPAAGRTTLLVSIAAGVPLALLAAHLKGATAISWGRGVTAADRKLVRRLFDAVGITAEVGEGLMDAVTGLSGSGPAYVFTAIQGLADGGVQAGLPRATALLLAAQTVLGSARMVLETGAHPHQLRDRVASPGGTTIRGIAELEERGVAGAFMAAVGAAAARSRELSSGNSLAPRAGRGEGGGHRHG
jgi:pyrroline-5-carboxylate reductase